MERDINPIEYLPPVLKEVLEIQELYKGITPELEALEAQRKKAISEGFVTAAEDYGLERLEAMLGITVTPSDTVDDRRLRILAAFIGDTPYTFSRVLAKLKMLCGEDNVEMDYYKDYYTLRVAIKLQAKSQYETVKKVLRQMIPCNISLNCLLVYNRHQTLKPFTHEQLKAYTHDSLRQEVLK